MVVVTILDLDRNAFFRELGSAIQLTARKSAFVFVHGFNVTFEEALRRTAQLAFDLGLDEAPILYSWPSQGRTIDYIADTTAAAWTVPHLVQFLCDLHAESGADAIHLIAHSMGSQALTAAIRMIRQQNDVTAMFQQLVLTAPDIDATIFERDIAPTVVGAARRTTLYASSADEVLAVSKRLNAFRRAGDAADGIVITDGVDSIDASAVATGLGHSTYGDVRTVIEDLALLLRLGLPPGDRNLFACGTPQRRYWMFPP